MSLSEREMTISCDESMVTDMDMQLEVDVDLKVPNYQEGDKIFAFFLPGNKTGTISRVCDIVSKSGHPIYEVIDEDGEVHEICETLFDSEEDLNFYGVLPAKDDVTEDISTPQEEAYIEKIRQENEAEMERIINSLGLKSSQEPINQLKNCCLLQAYMVENNRYNEKVMDEKNHYAEKYITDIDLHNALIKKSGVCTSNSIMFQSILSKLGIAVETVGLTTEETSLHMANIVLLNGEWYFFDVTLEIAIRNDNLDQNLVLCCAGLGSQDYCQYYTPQCIVRRDGLLAVPENISDERIPVQVVNQMIERTVGSEKQI